MDPTTASELDIETNRANIAYARSTKLIQSWLPPAPQTQQSASENAESQDGNESDFKSMPESSGVGSKVTFEEDAPLSLRRKGGGNEKLLEQLLGRRAAEVRRGAAKEFPPKGQAGSKALATRPKQKREVNSDDEDEGGRSSAFKSRKIKGQQRDLGERIPAAVEADADGKPDVAASRSTTKANTGENVFRSMDSEDEGKPAKRRKNTYLDELLSSRGKKSKKKKNKG